MTTNDKTVIGNSITIEGTVDGTDDLVVHGTVKGKLSTSKGVTVAKSGKVEADVNATAVEIVGALSGGIVAKGKAEITAGGRMIGDIKAPRIMIADGAKFTGNIDMGGA